MNGMLRLEGSRIDMQGSASNVSPTIKEPIRHRYMADRILLLLLYRPADEENGVERLEDGSLSIRMGKFSRFLKMNSSKLYEQFMFLESMGYLDLFDHKWKWGCVRIRPSKPLVRWNV